METMEPQKQSLQFLTILKEAFKLPYHNPRFIFFTLFASPPLFYTMLVYETILEQSLVSASNIINQTDFFYLYAYNWPIPIFFGDIFTRKFYLNFLTLAFLYRVCLFISELFIIVVTVVLASNSYKRTKTMTTYEILVQTRCDRVAITSFYVHVLLCCVRFGFVSLVASYYFVTRYGFVGYFFSYFFGFFLVNFGLVLLKMYLEWEAEWNMAIVVSILEGKYGTHGLGRSAYLGKGNEHCGFMLMLVFFLWGHILRSLSMFFGWYGGGRGGMIVQVGLLCVGIVMKWVVFTAYFFDCEARVVDNRLDEEVGKNVKFEVRSMSKLNIVVADLRPVQSDYVEVQLL